MMKKSPKICIFFLLFFMAFPTLRPQNAVKSKKVIIHADKGWQDSGILLNSGQYYSIFARGTWISGYGVPSFGPRGKGFGTITNGALLGWIDNNKPENLDYKSYTKYIVQRIILVGEGGLFQSYGEGKLWLGMGEWSGCKECVGQVEVLITVFD
ncbi:MAG: hypothetical protein MUP98_17785 [Candidatus Aminicenantes bacterium]|nr:hypothetical protein [Candidatus Aminicenantes bacterium]